MTGWRRVNGIRRGAAALGGGLGDIVEFVANIVDVTSDVADEVVGGFSAAWSVAAKSPAMPASFLAPCSRLAAS